MGFLNQRLHPQNPSQQLLQNQVTILHFSQKLSFDSASKSSSKSSSQSSDVGSSSSDWLDTFDLVLFIGSDALGQMFIEAPSTESTSNKSVVGVVMGLGLLVIVVALFSYWRKRSDNTKDEQSHLLTQPRYHSYN